VEAITEFFAMGGYAGYVWPAYGLTALVLGGVLFASVLGARRAARRLAELERIAPRRRARGVSE
jgi:heme exporter protein D